MRRREPDMDTFFSALLWLSVAALIVAIYLCYKKNHGKGRDIY